MRISLMVLGILCLLVGCVWLLQGINMLRGSFMSGQPKWALCGALLVVVGLGLLVASRRRRA
jgi:MYXO-CTERM domain-containing protein